MDKEMEKLKEAHRNVIGKGEDMNIISKSIKELERLKIEEQKRADLKKARTRETLS